MTEIIKQRRESNSQRLRKLSKSLADVEGKADGVACIYVIGSFGRGEASSHSDLDAFIVGRHTENTEELPALAHDIKNTLMAACAKQGFPEFDRGGDFLNHHTVDHLVKTLGKPEDDAENTFTARLLLLLESRPLIGGDFYDGVLDEVIEAYWRDYKKHKDAFMPMYLANDILRLWRTFCINYEARTHTEPAEKKAKRKLKNYKLKHSRLLTCYSALAYLLTVYKNTGTVHPQDALAMIKMLPTQRLEWIAEIGAPVAKGHVADVLDRYSRFLVGTDHSETELIETFMDRQSAAPYKKDQSALGNSIYNLLKEIGEDSDFFRLLVV